MLRMELAQGGLQTRVPLYRALVGPNARIVLGFLEPAIGLEPMTC